MKNIVVFPRGQLSQEDKQRMIDAEILVVEADDPRSVVQLAPTPPLVSAEDFLMAALHAVANGSEGNRFVSELYRRLKVREQAQREGV